MTNPTQSRKFLKYLVDNTQCFEKEDQDYKQKETSHTNMYYYPLQQNVPIINNGVNDETMFTYQNPIQTPSPQNIIFESNILFDFFVATSNVIQINTNNNDLNDLKKDIESAVSEEEESDESGELEDV